MFVPGQEFLDAVRSAASPISAWMWRHLLQRDSSAVLVITMIYNYIGKTVAASGGRSDALLDMPVCCWPINAVDNGKCINKLFCA
jgi:hypothetical protein